jgi:UDP-2-acetamido-2,6-beta-L-arabino-hexul-4-ose reductase
MIKVGITGQPGFMGTHLANYLNLKEEIEIIPFEDEYFDTEGKLKEFAAQCDVIVHLAAMNRHNDPKVIYETNIRLVKQVIEVLEELNHTPHIILSSSTQEERDNPYGRSKKAGRKLFEEWAKRNDAHFSGLIIPNVFGPFGVPFYNSFISTFSHQLANDLEPKIEIDAKIKLIYINDLVEFFYKVISEKPKENPIYVDHIAERKVTEVLKKLHDFKTTYVGNNIIPELDSYFDICLFNTFRTYIKNEHYPVDLFLHKDDRGHLSEVIKTKVGGQAFFSVTKPGITRGNHFHRRKIERFCVVEGEALIKLRKIGTAEVIEYRVSGEKPATIDMPIFYTHNITNVGDRDMYTLFWSNELFNPEDSDTFYEEV